jgi:hypothetical protein
VCHEVLQDPIFFRFLSRIDAEFAAQTRQSRCSTCEGPLHVADFPRKPRGCPAAVREEYSRRLSFTCGWCDQRSTPQSVRFLGRRVYVAVMLMLVSPPSGSAARALGASLQVPARTMSRWRGWWREDFVLTRFWASVRERFVPPIVTADLPQSLLKRFAAPARTERLTQLLRFVAPLSTRAVIG